MKCTGTKRNVCPGSCVSTGAKFPVAPVESAPMSLTGAERGEEGSHGPSWIRAWHALMSVSVSMWITTAETHRAVTRR